MARRAVATLPLVDQGFKTLISAFMLTCILVTAIQAYKSQGSGQSMFSEARPVDPGFSLPKQAATPTDNIAGRPSSPVKTPKSNPALAAR